MSIGLIPTRQWHNDFAELVYRAGQVDLEYQKALEAAGPREA